MSTYNSRKKATLVFVLGVMFGLGWIFGILGTTLEQGTASLVFQFIFIFIVGFQGLFIFLVHPCRSEDVRNQWKKWFYYVTCHSELGRYLSTPSAQKQLSASNSNRPTSTPLSAVGVSRRQTSLDNISFASSTGSSSHRPGRSVSAMQIESNVSAEPVTPTNLQAPTLDTVQEESIGEEVSPFNSLSLSSGDSFHIFGNNHADVDSDDEYFLSQ